MPEIQEQEQEREQESNQAGWYPYNLDHKAQSLIINHRDQKNVLTESYKMRMAVAYGLERFWGEHLRFERDKGEESQNKGKYWKEVWQALGKILKEADILLPDADGNVKFSETTKIEKTAKDIWEMSAKNPENYRIALAVLTQLCDSLVWWTQRYKKKEKEEDN